VVSVNLPKRVTTPRWPFVDDVEAAGQPDGEHQRDQGADAAAEERRCRTASRRAREAGLPPAPLASEQAGEATVDVAPDLVEIGRTPGSGAFPTGDR
jgi:hypothetical protein